MATETDLTSEAITKRTKRTLLDATIDARAKTIVVRYVEQNYSVTAEGEAGETEEAIGPSEIKQFKMDHDASMSEYLGSFETEILRRMELSDPKTENP